MVRISESIIVALIADLGGDEKKAADIFYTSKTYALLSDKETRLYQKPWEEIYGNDKEEGNKMGQCEGETL